uniref:Peptidase M13 C-terminal domain-containing protein n=1 Tax=viral metagenome TaxID=1070528 RepID=A0A6C0E343_9ZZZZ
MVIINKNKNTRNRRIQNNKTKKTSNYLKTLPNNYNHFENSLENNKEIKKILGSDDYQKSLIKAFRTPYAPSKITARSDYYDYINYSWILQQTKLANKVKKFYPQIDSFRVTQEKVYYELIDIVKKYTSDNNTQKSKAIDNVYKSFLTLNEKTAQQNVYDSIETIDAFIKKGDLLSFLAYINKCEMVSWASPIVWTMDPDSKNSKIYRSTISSPILSIYDYEVYIEDTQDDQDTKKNKQIFKNKFFQFINRMFDECIGKNHGLKAQDIWDVEYEMLIALGCNSVKNDSEDYYNVVKNHDSLTKYGFDWESFSTYLGFKKTPDFYICTSLNYLKCIMKTLHENWKTPKWRTYYIYMYVRQIMRFHKKWRYVYYDFFGKFMRGQPIIFPDQLYPVFGLSICFNTFLTNEYVERNKKEEYINYVNNMGQDLLTVFKRIIERNTWLSPKTKKYALLKLKYIQLIVGSPKILREDPVLSYSDNDPWNNMHLISQWRFKKYIELEGQEIIDIPTVDWFDFKLSGKQAYIVNAFYTPTENSIYVPLAYLQKPFIDLDERGIEYNLAHIGYTLAHEMSHSLDDMGSKYDYVGNLKNWWTKHDRKVFNLKVKDVIKQYETFAAYDGIKMDASLSIGENLADISGLAICTEYLRDFQLKNQDIISIQFLSFEAFFTYIAIQARQKIYDKAIKAQLKINPHPMDKYRTNCPLARLKLFQSIYNIQKGDKMFWHSTDTIW